MIARGRLEGLTAPPPELTRSVSATDDELRRLRDVLVREVPTYDSAAKERRGIAQARYERASRGPSRAALAIGVLVVVAGIPGLLVNALLGVLLLIAGVGLLKRKYG